MISFIRCLGLVALGFLCAAHERAYGQEPSVAGVYTLASGSQADIEAAIESAIEKMSFIKRPIARGRLKKTNSAYGRIAISRSSSQIEVQFDQRAPVRMPADGTAIKWTREDGEVFDVSADWQASSLVQMFKAEDGERVNTYRLDAADRLALQVSVSSAQLPAPVTYTLIYRRE